MRKPMRTSQSIEELIISRYESFCNLPIIVGGTITLVGMLFVLCMAGQYLVASLMFFCFSLGILIMGKLIYSTWYFHIKSNRKEYGGVETL